MDSVNLKDQQCKLKEGKLNSRLRYTTIGELIQNRGWDLTTEILAEEGAQGTLLHHPTSRLARIYVEPTNRCNLGCRTCIRHSWTEAQGDMDRKTFAKVMDAVKATNPPPEVFFGGFGEPLSHPDILSMITEAKETGARVELISNGTLLNGPMREGLIEAGLDFLWVSLDGAKPESYLDVRLGNELEGIIENLRALRRLRQEQLSPGPELGIAFVAMKRNIADLPAVMELGRKLYAKKLHVSNLIPYTREMQEEILYSRSLVQQRNTMERFALPRMDASPEVMQAMERMSLGSDWLQLIPDIHRRPFDTCPFVERGSTSVRWDGKVSPCLALLHEHVSYLRDRRREIDPWFSGDLSLQSLLDIWQDPAYQDLRRRLQEFSFAPCTICNSCELADDNKEDCFGSPEPACGGCLWAQGFISCP